MSLNRRELVWTHRNRPGEGAVVSENEASEGTCSSRGGRGANDRWGHLTRLVGRSTAVEAFLRPSELGERLWSN